MIVAGFGFRHGATDASFADALAQAAKGVAVDRLATLADKAVDLNRFAMRQNLIVIPVDPADADAVQTTSVSAASLAAKGLPSVAEATALAAVGAGSRLMAPRVISQDRMATCALAKLEDHS